jgi:hypothetical protein
MTATALPRHLRRHPSPLPHEVNPPRREICPASVVGGRVGKKDNYKQYKE